MKLNKQLSILVEEAPKHGISTQIMDQAIIPSLKRLAKRLTSLQYYIMQNAQGDLLITTLVHREKKGLKKTVIYAFLTPQDAQRFYENDPQFVAEAIPITHLLFQLFALSTVDSIIFMEEPQNLLTGTEIPREEVRASILQQIQKLPTTYNA